MDTYVTNWTYDSWNRVRTIINPEKDSLKYKYNGQNDQQVTEIADTSYRTTGAITKTPGRQDFTYDANGNLLSIHTTRMEAGGRENLVNTRNLLWDEENRLLGVSDNGVVSNYWYDASGERVIKQTGDGEGVLVNGRMSGGRTGTSVYSIYVNPYTVIGNGKQMSKHFYIGSQRIASQLCSSSRTGSTSKSPLTPNKAAISQVNYTTKYADLTAKVKTRYDSLDVPYKGKENTTSDFWTFSNSTSDERLDLFFYHPDHLGSSSIITNFSRQIVQHLEYVPFGEVFVDERITSTHPYDSPYKFNAKELDEETGLYYYGARYLDPRTSLWLSVDPLAEKYPGVSSYVYCVNNPIKYVDPDGRTHYISLTGKSFNVPDNSTDKKLVIHFGNLNQKVVDKALANNLVTSFPTNEEISKMNEAYGLAEKTGNETGYIKGGKGTLSRTEVGPSSKQVDFDESKNDIAKAGDSPERYTHVHIYQTEGGVITNQGNQNPTIPEDLQLTGGVNIILGYTGLAPAFNTLSNAPNTYNKGDLTRMIRFYNNIGKTTSMEFGDFSKMVNKVNNERK